MKAFLINRYLTRGLRSVLTLAAVVVVAGAMTAALTRLSQAGASRIKCALDWWVGTRIVENPLRSAFCAMRVNVS